jgi:tRNA A37 threonylcarbamoyladenosine dehydratase
MTLDEFERTKEELIRSLAAAAGIDPSRVEIEAVSQA